MSWQIIWRVCAHGDPLVHAARGKGKTKRKAKEVLMGVVVIVDAVGHSEAGKGLTDHVVTEMTCGGKIDNFTQTP